MTQSNIVGEPDVWMVEEGQLTAFAAAVPNHSVGNSVRASSQTIWCRDGACGVVVLPDPADGFARQRVWAEAGVNLRRHRWSRLGLWLGGLDADQAQLAVLGARRGIYRYTAYRPQTETPPTVLTAGIDAALAQHALDLADAEDWARDAVNRAPNDKPPAALAAWYQQDSPPAIRWELLDVALMTKKGMGGILAVGQGSTRPPVGLVGHYEGAPGQPWLALVGKGITFDSGGISLKNRDGMGRLKNDMAGSAAVMAAFRTAARQGLAVNVMALAPLAENLPGGGAYRPGDVLTMYDGTTVEVFSTDAEGRLVLADAVSLAVERDAAAIIDIATLTGSNVVGLGGIRASLVSNRASIASLVEHAGDKSGQPVWAMPTDAPYRALIEGRISHLKNSGGRGAGTITAGLFIGHFARNTPWAHIDMAGMGLLETTGIWGPPGATGYGVALLHAAIKAWADLAPAMART